MDTPSSRRGRYGFFATLLFLLLLLFVGLLAYVALAIAWGLGLRLRYPELGAAEIPELLVEDGLLLSLSVIVSGLAQIGVVALLIRLRRSGPSTREYLGLLRPRGRTVAFWLLLTVAYIGFIEVVRRLAGVELDGEVMVELYCRARSLPLLWLSFALVAPVAEEVVFRGFVLPGIAESRAGPVVGILFSSLAWTLLHLQYGLVTLGLLFGVGVVLGIARLRTGSLYVPIAMHVGWNVLALVGVHYEVMLRPVGGCP